MKTLIKNGMIVTMNEQRDVYSSGYVLIEDTKILDVGPQERLLDAGISWDREVDAEGAIVLPGMVNTHCHMGMIPFRGLGDDCKDRLRKFLLPMESAAMDEELTKLSTRYAICELLLAGVTTVLDMYYFAGAVAKIMDETGIRGFAGETVMEMPTCDAKSPDEAISYGENCMKRYQDHPRVRCCIAPHGTTTCSADTLKRIHKLDREYNVPFTLHVAEMDYEMTELREAENCTPVEYLAKLQVLDERTVSAHSIQLTETDIDILKDNRAGVSHCIASNTKAAKGVAPVSLMHQKQVAVGLGTDGPASGNTLDVFTLMRFCANFHKNETRDRSAFPAEEIVSMATVEGAKVLGLEHQTGSLVPGKEADLIMVETQSPNMFPIYDPYSALVYSARADNVRDVYVAGKCLVRNKQLTQMDFTSVKKELRDKMNKTAFGQEGKLI